MLWLKYLANWNSNWNSKSAPYGTCSEILELHICHFPTCTGCFCIDLMKYFWIVIHNETLGSRPAECLLIFIFLSIFLFSLFINMHTHWNKNILELFFSFFMLSTTQNGNVLCVGNWSIKGMHFMILMYWVSVTVNELEC